MQPKNDKDGRFCRFYAFNQDGIRQIFSFQVTNKQDAVHCLVRCKVASGYYVEIVRGLRIVNDRIYSNQRTPGYQAPHEQSWWKKNFNI